MPRNICAFSEIVVACGQWSRALARTLFVVRVELGGWVLLLFLGCGKLKSLFTVMLSVSVFVASTCKRVEMFHV